MGNTLTSKALVQAKKHSYEELRNNISFDGEIVEDMRYGSGLIITNHHLNIKMLLQTQTYTLLSQYDQCCDGAQNRLSVSVPTIVQLLKYNGAEYTNTQGTSFKISLLYEFCQFTLQEQIMQRAINQEYYDETQLFTLIDHILSSLLVFKFMGIRHSFIQPSSIFVSDGLYKLNDVSFMSGQNEYKRLQLGLRDGCYLSPKLFQELGQRAKNPVNIYEQSEVFSLARCVLDAALLQNLSELLYDFNTFSIKQDGLSGVMVSLKEHYSQPFCDLIRTMLDLKEESRINYQEITQTIHHHVQDSLSVKVQIEITKRYEHSRPSHQNELNPLSFCGITHDKDFDRLFSRLKENVVLPNEEYNYEQRRSSRMGTSTMITDNTKSRTNKSSLSPTPSPFKNVNFSFTPTPNQKVIQSQAQSLKFSQPTLQDHSNFHNMELAPLSPLTRLKNKKSTQVSPVFSTPKRDHGFTNYWAPKMDSINRDKKDHIPVSSKKGSLKEDFLPPQADSVKSVRNNFTPLRVVEQSRRESQQEDYMPPKMNSVKNNKNITPMRADSKNETLREDYMPLKVESLKRDFVPPNPVHQPKYNDGVRTDVTTVEGQGDQLQKLATKLGSLSFQVQRRASVPIPQQELQAFLPQSDVIHLHSGNSQYLNDIFFQDKKRNKQEPQRRDFWI